MQSFTDWLKNDAEDCGLCDPPMDSQLAVEFLQKYLLGDDWYYTGAAQTNAQGNTAVVFEILYKYSRKFRKEYKRYIRKGR